MDKQFEPPKRARVKVVREILDDLIGYGYAFSSISCETRISEDKLKGFNKNMRYVKPTYEEYLALTKMRIDHITRNTAGTADARICGEPSIERYMHGCRCADCKYIAKQYLKLVKGKKCLSTK